MRAGTWAELSRGARAGLLVAAAASLLASPLAAGVDWPTDAAAAFRQSRESGRPVLVYLTGSPCGTRAPIGNPGDVHVTDCERLDTATVATSRFAEAAARFEPLLVRLSAGHSNSAAEEDLLRRWKVGTLPTLLVADPWGNEVIRLVGPTPLDRTVRLLDAIPGDLRALREAGEALASDPESLPALVQAAAFYEKAGLRPVAERYYEQASGSPLARAETAARRSVAIPRGLNLLVMGRARDAARVFSEEAGRGRGGAQEDAVLFGWAMASLSAGDRKKAEELAADLSRRFPESPYAKKLAENLRR